MKTKEQLKGAAKTVIVLLLLLLCVWSYIGTRIGVWSPRGYLGYLICGIGAGPLGLQLWHGVVKPGDSVSQLLEKVNPYDVIQHGKWTEVRVAPGCFKKQKGQLLFDHIWILAENDRMVAAGFCGCTFQREFFNVLSPAERSENLNDYKEYLHQKDKLKQDAAQQSPPN